MEAQGISRRRMLAQLGSGLAVAVAWTARGSASTQLKTPIAVYKDRGCMCCGAWAEHMGANGFLPTVTDSDMVAIHAKYKIGSRLQSCHTGIVGDYIIEGHVPASDVKLLLARKPKGIRGLTIPGMPASAPGMDQLPFQPYTVLTFNDKDETTVFAKHDKRP